MKIAVSSDWHGSIPGKENRKRIEECDALLICGDLVEYNWNRKDDIARYLKDVSIPKIITPGNHDFQLYNGWLAENPDELKHLTIGVEPRLISETRDPLSRAELMEQFGVTMLIDEAYDLNGVKIYGTPWSPEFCRWAFMEDDKTLVNRFDKIPEGLDILISHTPPQHKHNKIDVMLEAGAAWRGHLGSKSLSNAILAKKPKYAFCGHIHSGNHEYETIGQTKCANVSLLTEQYKEGYEVLILSL